MIYPDSGDESKEQLLEFKGSIFAYLPIPRKNVHSSKDYDGDFHRK
jgi:hypothetical protein